MKIKVEIEINGVEDWEQHFNKNDKIGMINFFKEFNSEIKHTLSDNCGIDFYRLQITSKLIDEI